MQYNLSRRKTAFTLLELIISVALVLVLMLAITRIFTITSNAVGASQGLSAATRDARAAQAIFANDIGSMANDSPFIWIRSGLGNYADSWPVAAFRNADDERSDRDGDPLTRDIDGNGVEGENAVLGEDVSHYDVNSRSHRLDRFSFCARDRFYRQTGNTVGNSLVVPQSSGEAWIYYGPMCLPNNDGSFRVTGTTDLTEPGVGTAATNPNNYYASQWILGRFTPLMIKPDAVTGNAGVAGKEYYVHSTSGTSLTPFTYQTSSNTSSGAPVKTIPQARYDLVGVDIAQSRDIIKNYGFNWYADFMQQLLQVNPLITKPISAASASQQVPVFVQGCSQFIVEFAGDFCQQYDDPSVTTGTQTYGNVRSATPDGVIDFAIVNGQRRIRWYGYPRDTDGTPGISLGASPVFNGGDVVTVSDFVLPNSSAYSTAATDPVPFEHAVTNNGGGATRTRKSYTSNAAALRYFAAWGPNDTNRPKMYRITMVIDRPEMAGRTADGASFEFVFNAP